MNRHYPARPSSDRSPITWRDLRTVLSRHRRKSAICFVLVVLTTAAAVLFLPRVYRSEAKLLVRLGRENAVIDPTATMGQQPAVAVPVSRENEINSVVETVASRAMMEKLVDAVGPAVVLQESLQAVPAPEARASVMSRAFGWLRQINGTASLTDRHRAVAKLSKCVTVAPVNKTNVVYLSCSLGDPEAAQAIVSRLVDFSQTEHLRLNRTPGSRDFFSRQAQESHAALKQVEEELRKLKQETGLVAPERRREVLVTRVARLEDDLLRTEASRIASDSKLKELRSKLSQRAEFQETARTAGFGNEGTDAMRRDYFNLKLKEAEAVSKYTPDHPLYKEIRRQVAEADKVLGAETAERTQVTIARDKLYEEIQNSIHQEEVSLATLNAESQSLKTQLADAREAIRKLADDELRVAQLDRELQLHDADYRRYAANLEQARIDQALEDQKMSNISVAEPATLDPRPVEPRIAVLLVLGMVASLAGSLGVALVAEYFSDLPASASDVDVPHERPAMNSIPRFEREVSLPR